ncbi:TIGR02302 family protein [Hoeflea sp. WL0058]|uniref:TIGR02302 family protein n=1 Tax=Flavimaribacter sediminis TaxID=2865987 RepID=A0AAE3D4H3_9HYPH|nr:TIGR02302 family protein [Flavimaribacter sediminis]MBW8640776.1 TIGR02302 family protein [Flavimaribacter sediminis]
MNQNEASNEAASKVSRLARISVSRQFTRVVIFLERLWPRLLPAFGVLALFAILSWIGYFRAVPDWARIASLAAMLAAFLASLVPLRRLRWPDAQEATRRLEKDNRIAHQAIAVQSDRLENDSEFARVLWQTHKQRMYDRLDDVHVHAPKPDTPRADPWGVRALVALLLVAAFGYSWSNHSGRLGDAFTSHARTENLAGIRIDAWVTPPAYTGKAPLFLTGGEIGLPDIITVPEGSEVLVRIVGGQGSEAVAYNEETIGEEENEDGVATAAARNYRFPIPDSGRLEIRQAEAPIHGWTFDLLADEAPVIAFEADPAAAANGALEIAFSASDDYGLESARAEILPVEPSADDANPLYDLPEYELTVPKRNARSRKGRESRDLTEHPMAGKAVKITLVATDATGQEGRSETVETILPARTFYNLLAGSVAEQRQILSLDTNDLDRAVEFNDALTMAAEETIDNTTHYLLIKSARARMRQAFDDDMLRDAADYMWDIAIGIEDGDLSFAERRLRDAQRALSEALENGADDETIQALMDELREAMQEFLEALAQAMQQNPEMAQQMPPQSMQNILRQQDIDRLLDQIENLAQSGARDQAQQLLSELQRMMNNLQTGQHQQAQGDNPMRQRMDELGELMQRQQQLMEETFDLEQALRQRRQQQLFGNEGQQQQQQGENGQQQQGEMGDMTEEQLREALRQLQEQQDALQQQLGELQQALEEFGIQPGEGFDEAGEAMGEAGEALGEGEGGTAVDEQGRALQALRRGAQDMMNQMRQAMGQNPGPMNGQASPNRQGRDPLGRPQANTGPDFGENVKIPEEADIQRARRILEAIRDRLGDAFRPEMERFYLERLLDNNN